MSRFNLKRAFLSYLGTFFVLLVFGGLMALQGAELYGTMTEWKEWIPTLVISAILALPGAYVVYTEAPKLLED